MYCQFFFSKSALKKMNIKIFSIQFFFYISVNKMYERFQYLLIHSIIVLLKYLHFVLVILSFNILALTFCSCPFVCVYVVYSPVSEIGFFEVSTVWIKTGPLKKKYIFCKLRFYIYRYFLSVQYFQSSLPDTQ